MFVQDVVRRSPSGLYMQVNSLVGWCMHPFTRSILCRVITPIHGSSRLRKRKKADRDACITDDTEN
jgi:hypothetical protein